MSIEALNWAFNVQVPSAGAKLVLLTLSNYASDEGLAFPSQKALAEKTCLSERAIRDNLVRLEEWKLLSRVPRTRSNGSYTTDLFKLNIGAVAVIQTAGNDEETQRQNLPTAESADGRILQTQRQNLPEPAAESAGPEPSLTTTITNYTHPHAQAREALAERGIPDEIAGKWLLIRETKGQEVNQAALDLIEEEAKQAGVTFAQAIECCCENMWAWFKASWYAKLPGKSTGCGAQGPPKASTGEGWRNTTDGVVKRGMELGMEARPGESQAAYAKRVAEADLEDKRLRIRSVVERQHMAAAGAR